MANSIFAKRVECLDESATFKYSALAKNKIDLTIGRTNFDAPTQIKEATKDALDGGKIFYTKSRGIVELREKILEKLERENKIHNLDVEKIIVSVGAKQIIFEAVMALIDRNDEVAIPDPSWVSYESIVRIAEGKVVWLPLKAENGFIPDEDFFSVLENSNPRLIFINSPNNPTGAVYSKKIMERIVDIAERKNSFILSDEIYEKIIYEGRHISIGSMYENTITVNGFSKEFSMTGFRLGYGACPIKEVIDKMNLIQTQSVSCATSFVQYGAIAAFSEDIRDYVDRMVSELRERRDFLFENLKEIYPILEKPGGAFYFFPKINSDDIEYCDKLLENGVAAIPGSPFGPSGKGCIRISYGGSEINDLRKAIEILKSIQM
ncbi:MAG: hypothetical protein DRO90_00395 [Candidatus Altiarchaeales archaeon]|nr:MAG: hypothetical protein DRO95_03950 [Candidatus Altiarchaeales archaeon]RLI94276.1 MAG: hypothetical protein DRO94_03265 [Candidatus Altiarchaeales archaeon]RLI95381.1 MAG: hypothetical protein DRO90_00395 [Candidatus Altiarchaeales archaeon]HDO82705.1 pyridoxal phosphate-dependent aminotransferase [Candidatus Altiarchaeales archaeon]HEX55354.1 pyridoxal phosphate-dependent aminotransferase [Candidatus Altiarchaeales archaeon]